MAKCNWITESGTGDLVLVANGKECGRIPLDSKDTKGSTYSLDDLKAILESECKCNQQ